MMQSTNSMLEIFMCTNATLNLEIFNKKNWIFFQGLITRITLIKILVVKKHHVKYDERLTSEKMKKLTEEKIN